MPELDPALVPALHVLEAKPPAEQAAFFTSALTAPSADATPATKAAHSIFRWAALGDVDTAALESTLRNAGLGEACAAAASQCWGTHGDAARHGLLLASTKIHRLVDLDWKFGGARGTKSAHGCSPADDAPLIRSFDGPRALPPAVSASSSEHAAMGQTFVQLRLIVEGEAALECVHMGAPDLICCARMARSSHLAHPRLTATLSRRRDQAAPFLRVLDDARGGARQARHDGVVIAKMNRVWRKPRPAPGSAAFARTLKGRTGL